MYNNIFIELCMCPNALLVRENKVHTFGQAQMIVPLEMRKGVSGGGWGTGHV